MRIQFCDQISALKTGRVAGPKVIHPADFREYVKANMESLLVASRSERPDEGDELWAVEDGVLMLPLPSDILYMISGGIGPRSRQLEDYCLHIRFGEAMALLKREFALAVDHASLVLQAPDLYLQECREEEIEPIELHTDTQFIVTSIHCFTEPVKDRNVPTPVRYLNTLAYLVRKYGVSHPKVTEQIGASWFTNSFWRDFAEVGDE